MKVVLKQYVHSRRCEYTGKLSYHLFVAEMSEYGYVMVNEQEITIDIPDDFNPVASEIEMLRAAKQKIQAEAQVKANAIEDQISKLSSIEYRP